ncbi:MAG: hypothetical protein ACP5VE_09115 [Chthonomonadales bacterium]
MWLQPENDQYADELFLAGERVTPGIYKQLGTGREVYMEKEDVLPASLDGRVACYVRMHLWGAHLQEAASKASH